MGYEVAKQPYMAGGIEVRNLEAVIEPGGSNPARTLVVGAIYDCFLEAPGANDNATGVAGIIELAPSLFDLREKESLRIRIVLCVNEEPPFLNTEEMGSLVYANRLKASGDPVMGMLSLETMGFLQR